MEQKIKALLSSPIEENQRLGCNLAKSVLNWSNFDIIMYVLNTSKNWKLYKRVIYGVNFLGGKIFYSLKYAPYDSFTKFRLIFRSSNNKKIGTLLSGRYKKTSNIKFLQSYANKFIEQNL